MAAFTPVGVEAVVKGFGSFNKRLGQMSNNIAKFGATAAKAAIGGVAAIGAAAAGVGAASLKAAVDFESAFAGVIKTTDGLVDSQGDLTESGLELQKGFRNLAKEVPTAVEELLRIGELGGQLGIAKEDLVDFTKVIADLGESTSLTVDEAAVDFAQIASILGTPTKQIENMGSAVVELGNKFSVASEKDIVNFAKRIAGAGKIAGLTEADIFGISAAFASVGIQAQAGGSAINDALIQINKAALAGGEEMEIFAAVAGLSADEFATAWEENAGAVFSGFVTGLGEAGDDAVTILEALGIKGDQATRAFLTMAGAGDRMSDTMAVANKGFDENVALAEEAEKRYRTTAAQFSMLKNTLKDVGITIGQALLPFLRKLLSIAKPLIEEFAKKLPAMMDNFLIPAIERVAEWIGSNLPTAIQIATDFWNNILQPTVQAFFGFVSSTLIPMLAELSSWLGTSIPIAVQTASDFWSNTLEPILKNVQAFIQDTLIPTIDNLVTWMDTSLPMATETLSTLWTGTLQPALESVSDFLNQVVLPAFEKVISFVSENAVPILAGLAAIIVSVVVPAFIAWGSAAVGAAVATITALAPVLIPLAAIGLAVGLLVKIWESNWGGIRDFLTEVWENELKPRLEELKEWLEEKVPQAIETLKTFWVETLKPAMAEVVKFIEKNVIPNLEKVWEWLQERIPEAISFLEGVWNNVLKPILEKIGSVIKDIVLPALSDLAGILRDDLVAAFKTLEGAWNNVLKPVLDAVATAFGAIAGAIGDAIGLVNDLIGAISRIKIPEISLPSLPNIDIPGFQSGGFLAQLHPNEVIVPLDNPRTINVLANAMSKAFRSIMPAQQMMSAPVSSSSHSVTNIRNVTVNPTLNNAPSEASMFFDVSAALAASR